MVFHRLTVLVFAILAPPLAAQDEESFAEGLEDVHKFMSQQRWEKAQAELDELLEEHAERPYAIAHRELLIEDARRIAFWTRHEAPPAESLVNGRLEDWESGSRPEIEIVYEQPIDWSDWHVGKWMVSHPLAFRGPFEITIRGNSWPWDDSHSLRLCEDGDVRYTAFMGVPRTGRGKYWPARLYREVGDEREELDELNEIPAEVGRPFEIHVEVSARKIEVEIDGKEILEGKRERDDAFGTFSFDRDWTGCELTSIRIAGEVTSTWVEGLVDAALQDVRAEFDASFDPAEVLPAWLVEAERTDFDLDAVRAVPHPQVGTLHRAWDQVPRAIEQGRAADALAWLEALDDGIPDSHRAWLACVLHHEQGELDQARASCGEVLEADPNYLPARLTEAWLARGGVGARLLLLRALADDFPNTPPAVLPYLHALLADERLAEAQAWADGFSRAHPHSPAVAATQSLLVKADKGPVFADPTDYRTEHYEVVTDMDREICVEAAKRLQRMYRAYELYLRRVPSEREKDGRFRVYLFSGEAGFHRYSEDVLGGKNPSAAGLYSPIVKQLLIWNLPDRDRMFRTIQHEGFHQYLDRLMPDPPVWLDEGMASYYELADFEDGQFTEGQVDPMMLTWLGRKGFAPLDAFLRMDDRAFRSPAFEGRNYAQGWLLVHFLRNGETEHRRLFEELIDALIDADDGLAAVQNVFAEVDLAALESALHAHYSALSGREAR